MDGRTALCVRSIVASLPLMAELLCMRDRSWLFCRGWALLPRIAEVLLRDPELWVDLRFAQKSSDSRFACMIPGLFYKARIRGLCSKSSKGLNLYFAHTYIC